MTSSRPYLIAVMWVAWCVVWWLWSRNVKPDRQRESRLSRASHIVPLALAVFLVAAPRLPGRVLDARFLPPSPFLFWSGLALLAAGLLFSVWARAYLGRNWSGVVTIKEDHELVRSGPYRYVRHPIYSGLLLAFVGTAVAQDRWRGLVAVAIAFAAFWMKARIEERWLTQTFGDQYAKYRREVAALVPLLL